MRKRLWTGRRATWAAAAVAAGTALGIGSGLGQTPATGPAGSDIERLTALEAELTDLETEIQRLEDIKAIKQLQRAYGYYADKKLADQIGSLFADDATVEIGGYGVYVGRERITQFYDWVMGGPLRDGQLNNHIIMQGVVTVEPGASTGKGRWRALIQIGEHGKSAVWAEGPYENEYVRENGVWKFSRVHWYQTVSAPYDPGWHEAPLPMPGPSEEFPPDRPPTEVYESFPGAYLPPYHYPNPVTGRPAEVPDE